MSSIFNVILIELSKRKHSLTNRIVTAICRMYLTFVMLPLLLLLVFDYSPEVFFFGFSNLQLTARYSYTWPKWPVHNLRNWMFEIGRKQLIENVKRTKNVYEYVELAIRKFNEIVHQ